MYRETREPEKSLLMHPLHGHFPAQLLLLLLLLLVLMLLLMELEKSGPRGVGR
jgi:hypothetical protein